jgi:DDE superfamily endonuclease
VGASERDDEWLRAAWRALIGREVDARRPVFVDECGTHTSLAPLYAWARLGERAHAQAPRNRGKNTTTLLASMTAEGMGPCMGRCGRQHDHRGLRGLRRAGAGTGLEARADRGVMDNLAAHKGERVRELVEGRGCGLSYLPPYYSPDLNPIEEAFSKVKISLRRAGARTREALVEAMGRALDAVTPQDARGFFKHCGYGLRGQSL